MKKKILSLLLVFAMVLTMVPAMGLTVNAATLQMHYEGDFAMYFLPGKKLGAEDVQGNIKNISITEGNGTIISNLVIKDSGYGVVLSFKCLSAGVAEITYWEYSGDAWNCEHRDITIQPVVKVGETCTVKLTDKTLGEDNGDIRNVSTSNADVATTYSAIQNGSDIDLVVSGVAEGEVWITYEENQSGEWNQRSTKNLMRIRVDDPETISYLDWNATQKKLSTKSTDDYTEVKTFGSNVEWPGGIYVVRNDATIDGSVFLAGDVTLILCDGATLTVKGSIRNSAAGTLTVCGQSAGTGILNVKGANGDNDTEGNGFSGDSAIYVDIMLNGGTVNATGGNGGNGKEESGYCGGDGGSGIEDAAVTVHGGTLNAKGGDGGKGGGFSCFHEKSSSGHGIEGGTFTITDGIVNAIAGAERMGATDLPYGIKADLDISGGFVNCANGMGIKYLNTVSITDGYIYGSNDFGDKSNTGGITGGKYSSMTMTPVADGYKIKTINETYNESTFTCQIVPDVKVCEMNGTKYSSIKDAIDGANKPADESAASPSAIRLIADVEGEDITIAEGRFIVLDLNGKVLSGTGSGSVITNNGILTVKDSGKTAVHYFNFAKNDAWTLNSAAASGISISEITRNTADDTLIKVLGGCITGGIGTAVSKYAPKRGGGIYNTGDLTVTGGNIIGNTAGIGGGLYNLGQLNMTDGNIVGNKVSYDGGGMQTASNAAISGGMISFNVACLNGNSNGGGIASGKNPITQATGILTISGTATITNNTADSLGGGIFNSDLTDSGKGISYGGTLVMVGGTVSGNMAPLGGGVLAGESVTVGGSAKISGNTLADGATADDLYLISGKTIAVSSETAFINGASVGIAMADPGQFTTASNVTEDTGKYFFSDSKLYAVKYNSAYLELGFGDNFDWYFHDPAANAFTISSVDELEALACIVNNNTDNFENDVIVLSHDFCADTALTTAIGTASNAFKGAFDGRGKEIKLNISAASATDSICAGLFGIIEGAVIKNVGTSGVVSAASPMAVAGGIVGSAAFGATIMNCYSTALVSASGDSPVDNGTFAGGIVGKGSFTLQNCYATGVVTATGTNSYAGGILGGKVIAANFENCFFNNVPYGVGGYISFAGIETVGEINKDTICSGMTALEDSQMKACEGESNETWAELGGKTCAMTDALNGFAQDNGGCYYWGIMNDRVNGGYPVFAMNETVCLYNGKAYTNSNHEAEYEIALPAGVTATAATGTAPAAYTFTNVNISSCKDNCLRILDETAVINFAGENQFGVQSTFASHASKAANYGIDAENCNLTVAGRGSVTTYSVTAGVRAASITFGDSFTGTVTSYDRGEGWNCCLTAADTVIIQNGTFKLNNKQTYGIHGNNVVISGGNISVKGGEAAVCAETTLTIANTLTVNGANETYGAGVTKLTNKAGTEYVTFRKKPAASNGSTTTITVPVSGDKDTVQVTASISGSNATVKNVSAEEIAKVAGSSNVIVDLTGLGKSVTGAFIPRETFENMAASGAKGLEIRLSGGTDVVFDKAALSAIAGQSAGDSIQLVIDRDRKAEQSLNSAQKKTIGEFNRPVVLDAYFVSAGVRISDFQGGKAEVTASYPTVNPVRVWFVAEDGEKTLVPSTFDGKTATFTVTHFSHYVVEQLEDGANGNCSDGFRTCPKDETCVYAPFADADPMAWYHDGVHFCVENKFMNGVGSSRFAPSGTLSRAMVVTMLWNMEGQPAVDYAMNFTDVAEGQWYAEAIRWAQSTGVVKGYSDSSFRPANAVTREQLATILMQYAAFKGMDVSARADLAKFTDAGSISSWAVEYVRWANAEGIINGRSANIIAPTGNATRAEAACMLKNFCENILKK